MTQEVENIRVAQSCPGTIGRWQLRRVIGFGGTATVYEAQGPAGEPVAVKVLHDVLARDAGWWRRVEREADLLATLHHPGVPRLHEVGTDNGVPYLVMDLLKGRSLENQLDRPIPIPKALQIAQDALEVLAAVHAVGGVHRDLKPSNLFETTEGTLKILDFGIAGQLTRDQEQTSVTKGLLGTPAYMPPEQARGRWELVDHRSDIWALGAVIYRLITGEYVHPAPTQNEQLGKAMTRSAPPISRAAPGIDPSIARVIDRALAYDREDRWQSAAEFRAALSSPASADAAGVNLDQRTRVEQTADSSEPVRKHRRRALVAVPAGIGLVASLSYLAIVPPRAERPVKPAASSLAHRAPSPVSDTKATTASSPSSRSSPAAAAPAPLIPAKVARNDPAPGSARASLNHKVPVEPSRPVKTVELEPPDPLDRRLPVHHPQPDTSRGAAPFDLYR